jgi:hypothetical protein
VFEEEHHDIQFESRQSTENESIRDSRMNFEEQTILGNKAASDQARHAPKSVLTHQQAPISSNFLNATVTLVSSS